MIDLCIDFTTLFIFNKSSFLIIKKKCYAVFVIFFCLDLASKEKCFAASNIFLCLSNNKIILEFKASLLC